MNDDMSTTTSTVIETSWNHLSASEINQDVDLVFNLLTDESYSDG